MDSHEQHADKSILQKAVAALLDETRYECSVIRDFNLPSNYLMHDIKIPPVKKKKVKLVLEPKGIKTKSERGNREQYRQNVLFREKYKKNLRELYRREIQFRQKKIFIVQQRRLKITDNIATWFRQQVKDGPIYVCSVCIKLKFRKQVVQLDRDKYFKKGKQSAAVANQCYSQYGFICTEKIWKALEYLKESNPYYKETSLNQTWHDGFPPDFEDLTMAKEEHEVNPEIKLKQREEDQEDKDQNNKDKGFPSDTCLQPVDIGQEMLDQHFDDIFCVAPDTEPTYVKSIVDANRNIFEKNAEALEEAEMLQADGPQEDAWALIAPEAEAERLEAEMNKEQLNEEDIFGIPELDTTARKCNQGHDIEIRQTLFPASQMKTFMQQLKTEQKDVFYKIRQWCTDKVNGKNPEPFRVFINGGAGTGKSHLIKCMHFEVTKILSTNSANPDDIVVLLTAPTATAAFNIRGTTLHQAFSLPQSLPLPYIYLRDDTINKLRSKLQNLTILIIDEISMVGQRSLLYVSERFRQIKQSGTALFGNISVIAVGDFYQLPPIKQKCLYDLRPENSFPLWKTEMPL
ncbi:unnamed protein product [Mytilus coruscus]|uniref:ATP-dependent DNA helicase n=1 Tax=Mytilus coruscus TaxID=42192 RepID=A0A6J8CD85_MYTCO|nr:unnamed protein product [Mytilus coruscus]